MADLTHVSFELSQEFLDLLRQAAQDQDRAFVRATLADENPADISQLLDELDTEECQFVIETLPEELSALILRDLESDTRRRFLSNFRSDQIAAFVDYLDSDDGADVINEQPVKVREEVILHLRDAEKTRHILELMRYEEDVAGGLMAKELIKAREGWTVVQTIEEIRRQGEQVDRIYSVYVVDEQDRLLGKLSLKKLLLAKDATLVADLYDEDTTCVHTYTEEEEVVSIMRAYDLEAIPVVNLSEKLVGRITVDDVLDVMHEQAEQERQLMAGISDDVDEDDSVWMLSKARLPWLMVGMVGGLLGAQFIGLFEAEIAIIPAMAFFIPLITATGGNVGIQSSSIVLQSLSNKSQFSDRLWRRLGKVVAVAVINGLALSGVVFGVNFIFNPELELSLVVSFALFSVVLLASIMGTITPLVLDRLGVNPALASGPFITTANDLLGLGVYFSVASLLYSAL